MTRGQPKKSIEQEYSSEEEEIEPEPPIKENINPRTGKPRRKMSEAQMGNLVKARAAARIKKDELKGMRLQEKKLKKEAHLVKKLDLEARIKEHEDHLRLLACRAGRISKADYEATIEKKVRKKSVKRDPLEDDDVDIEEKNEINELEERLNKLKFKSKLKAKKPIIIEESEEEKSEEEAPKRGRGTPASHYAGSRSTAPVSRSASVESTSSRSGNPKVKFEHTPDVPDPSSRKKTPNPMERENLSNNNDEKMKATLRCLFPTGNF
jgi:hypothetical protein